GLLYHIDEGEELYAILNESVPTTLAGADMKKFDNGDLVWVANAISSFGFTVNHDFLDLYGLPVPATWEELATPTYYISDSVKAISMGDPPLTTSNTRIYQIILQAFGWEEGWKIITRMGANAGIYPGSGDTRAAVVSGEVGIAMTIDFYGTIANRENPACEYIIPEGQSIVNGDPIALGVNVDDYDEAVLFLEFVTSPAGQTAWMAEGLDRLPVNDSAFYTPEGSTYTELWALYNETLANEGIPFDEELATSNLATTIYYWHNTIEQKHNLLRRTWGELVTQYEDLTINATTFLDLSNQIGVPGMTKNESIAWNPQYQLNATFAAEKDAEWREYAKAQYCDILSVLGDPCSTGPDPTDTNGAPFAFVPALMATLVIATITLIYRRKKKK
ncbi:MAG: ABC transporter substrate-binding protein, partial [Candidatus Heimdallarchaeaceae archaeon]